MAKYYTNTEELELIADAIREKGGTNAQLTFPNEFVSAIENLPTGGGTVIIGNDVVFYDYDGTIVASYSASAFAQLSQLPANPTHAGLVAQGWNWSLAEAKTHVAKYGKLNIGQMYITESGATEIDVIMQKGRLEPILTVAVKGTVTVDWGDETTPDTVTGTSLSTRLAVPHTYAQAGTYTISISAEENNQYSFHGTSIYTLLRKNTTENENKIYANTIQRIRIGNNASIKDYAFCNCYSLMSITLPNSITSMGVSTFQYCYSLVSITIPNTVTIIGGSLFQYDYSLTSIIIPNDVTSIGSYALYNCSSLKSVTIPDTVTSIGNYAFQNCQSLTGIIIPSGISSIEVGVFQSCFSFSSITIQNGVTSIGNQAFQSCWSVTNITIPDSVTSIGNYAFATCYSLINVTIPDTITSINNNMFQNCYSLANITIPDSVTNIGNQAFQNCYSLSNITIPDSVTSIGEQAFIQCRSLASITIPDSVTSIGNDAFKNCHGVAEYHILPTTPPTAGTTIFNGIVSDCVIYVPAASLETYKTAENWSNYASYMQGE